MSTITETKPSGLGIRYEGSRHRYWLQHPDKRLPGSTFEDIFENPQEGDDWCQVESVSRVLKCLDKPALPWWGMKIGVEGVMRLIQAGDVRLNSPVEVELDEEALAKKKPNVPIPTDPVERAVERLTQRELTVNHVKHRAGRRGQTAHDAFETYCRTGVRPYAPAFPDAERGYIVALNRFFDDAEMRGGFSENMVGSWDHMLAGRYDRWTHLSGTLVARLDKKTHEPTGVTEEWNDVHALLDVKTAKHVYPEHWLQLEGYQGLSVESGLGGFEERAVIHLTAEGFYEVRKSEATYDDFLAVLVVSRIMKRLGKEAG